VIIDVRGIW